MFAYSCKQNNVSGQKANGQIELKEITIKVKGDEGVEVYEPNSFKVIESSSWKDIRKRAEAMLWLYDENKIIKEWRIKDANGKVLQDGTTFKKDETVFAITKEKPLKNPITITIQADEGYRFKEATQPCTIQVEKGEKWYNIKPKARAKIELKEDYEERAWKLGGKDGSYLTESTYIFSANATIYARSEKEWIPKIRISVYGDYGVEIPYLNNDIEVDEGSKWADIKAEVMAIATPREYFEIKEWHLNDKDGKIIEDTYEFKEFTSVYAVSSRIIAQYKVEHLKENIEDDNYTKAEEETKTGEAGKDTNAEAKQYEGFSSQWPLQSVIKADGSTVVQIKYKRNIVSLVLDLDGGKTETELTKTWGGKSTLKGKFEARVEVKTPTKYLYSFEKWEPELLSTFPKENDNKVYTAKWKDLSIRIRILGDERVEIEEPEYVNVPIDKTFGEIKTEILKKTHLKSAWSDEYYSFYDWRMDGEEGKEITDSTLITDGMVVYVRTNYKRLVLEGTKLKGWEGQKPRGRIFLPKEITEIKDDAFKDCEDLTSVDLSGCTKLSDIWRNIFSGCSKLRSVNLNGCVALRRLNLRGTAIASVDLSSCTELENIYFQACKSLESIDLSPCTKLKYIDQNTFSLCSKLKSINLNGCVALTNFGLGGTAIASIDLSSCIELENIYFRGCENLESIDVSSCSKLKSFNCHGGCSKLKSVNLNGCIALTQLFLDGVAIPSIDLSPCTNLLSFGLSEATIANIDLSPCTELKYIGLKKCKNLESVDISPCTKLTSLNLGGTGITNIDLSSCIKLTSLNLSDTKITSIDLSSCTELESLDLNHAKITTIDLSSYSKLTDINFAYCDSLESVDLSSCTKLASIKQRTFDICSKLKSVNLSGCSELTNIERGISWYSGVFRRCSSLESIDLSQCTKLKNIGGYMFQDCSKLKSVNLNGCSEIDTIEEGAFYNCRSLESIDLSQCTKLSKIEDGAFRYCSELKSIDLSSCIKIASIGMYAFQDCSKLKSVNLNRCREITDIGEAAFYKCMTLESIDLSPCTKLKKIEERTFSDCRKAEVKLPTSIMEVKKYAFGRSGLNENYCKKVLVPNIFIKEIVGYSNYPEDKIELYH